MRKLYGVLVLLGITVYVNAQTTAKPDVLLTVDQMPEYPGGLDSLLREVSSKIIYPQVCRDSNIQGKVYVRFVVNEDGSISDIEAKAPHPLLKAAAIDAIKTIGKFKPGMNNGKAVKVWYSVPVRFKIDAPAMPDSLSVANFTLQQPSQRDTMHVTDSTGKVYTIVEQQPEFPGGEVELMRFLQQNIVYPREERDNGISGRVLLRFVVDETGSVTDVRVMRGVSLGLDNEAVRVVSILPKFKPGRENGKAVRVYFNLPISFALESGGYKRTSYWDGYKGGYPAFGKLIERNLHYPENARANKIEANIFVQCQITDDLKLVPVKVMNDPEKIFSDEAMRVINACAAVFDKSIKENSSWKELKVIQIPFHLPEFPGREETDALTSDVYYQTGVTSFKKANYKVALEEFSDAIKTSSINADAYFNRAITKLKLNDPTGACDDFKRAYLLGELDALKGIQQACK